LGIEDLVSRSDGDERPSKLIDDVDERERRIEQGADRLAQILKVSRATIWLFVPGNNDLFREKPDSIIYYHDFIRKLQGKARDKRIVDLCPEGRNQNESWPFVYSLGSYGFVGFDDASFKNDDWYDVADSEAAKARPRVARNAPGELLQVSRLKTVIEQQSL